MFDGLLSSSIPARRKRAPALIGLVGVALCASLFSLSAGAQVILQPPARRKHVKHPDQQQLQARRAQFQPNLKRMQLAPRLVAPSAPRPVTRLLIKLQPGVNDHTFAAQLSTAALHNPALHAVMATAGDKPLLRYVRRHPGIGWTTYEVPSPALLQPTIDALSKDPDVIHVEADYRVKLMLPPPNNHYWGVLDWEHTFAVWGLGDSDENSVLNDDSTQWNYSWSQEQVSAYQAWSVYPGHYETAAERMNLLSTDPARLPIVGDIDTGIDLTHPNFSYTGNPSGGITDTDVRNGGQLSIQFSRAFAGPNFDGYQGDDPTLAMDDYGHGTGTSGLIGSAPNTGSNDAAFVRANPGVTWDLLNEQVYPSQIPGLGFPSQIVEMKILDAAGDGSDSDIIDAMEYASADWTDPNTGITHPSPHCVILNMSLALDTTNYPQALQDAVDFCWAHGTLVVAAAGNDGAAAGGPGANTPRYPARCDKVLAVSATTYNFPQGGVPEQITTYSDYGDQIGVAAPGGDLQTYINSGGGGTGCCCCGFGCGLSQLQELIMPFTLQPSYYTVINDPNGQTADSEYASLGFDGLYLGQFPGTSVAAPQVVGLAALYASKNRITQSTPNGPQLIVNAIELGADNINGNPNGGYEPTYGWGRINAAATIQDLNNRGATVGGLIGRMRYIDTVVGNVTVTAKAASGGATYPTTTDPDGLYHLANLPAAPGGTLYNVTATVFGGTATAQVKVMPGCDQLGINLTAVAPLTVKSFVLSPASVVGSLNSTATVTLNQPVTANTTVTLSSNSAVATVPASITIPAGTASQTFVITTNAVTAKTSVILTATAGTSSKNATLTVTPFGVKTLTLSPTSVSGSLPVLATVSLQFPVNSGSVTVSVSSSSPSVAKPVDGSGNPLSSITISAPNQSGTFNLKTFAVTSITPVSIVATANGVTKSATLSVKPIGLQSLSIHPTSVTSSQSAVGTLTLQVPAAPGAITVSLSSNAPSAAQPVDGSGNPLSSITIPAGSQTATLNIATYPVAATTSVTIVATAGGITKSATLSVKPVALQSFTLSPTSTTGGNSVTGTLTLTSPAGPGSIKVTFTSNSSAVPAPASITIPAGSQTGTVTINTNAVAAKTSVTLSATASGIKKSATLTVKP